MPDIVGILETAIYVADLDKARSFYEDIVGLKPIHGDDRMSAYNAGGHGVFLIFKRGASTEAVTLPGGTIPPHDGHGPLHFAFAIDQAALAPWEETLHRHAIVIESRVRWPHGGTSLYFRDPDGHLVELATPGIWPNY